MRIRLAGPDDAEAWLATLVAAQAAAYVGLMPPEFAARRRVEAPALIAGRRAQLSRQQADPVGPHRAWIAEDDAGPVAVAEAGPGPTDWEVERGFPPPSTDRQLHKLYALPRGHGTGLGQALLDHAVGDGPAYLWIMTGNARAEAFYRRNRFVPDGLAAHAGPSWFGRPMFRMHRL